MAYSQPRCGPTCDGPAMSEIIFEVREDEVDSGVRIPRDIGASDLIRALRVLG